MVETRILDSLVRQLYGSEDIDITNIRKIFKLGIVFENFDGLCPFLSLTLITGQRNFLSLQNLETCFLKFALLSFFIF